jgi:hypothetical protein
MVPYLARALALLIAACVAPSLANAHAGHAHSAPAAHSTPMTGNVAAAPAGHQDTTPADATIVIRAEVFSTTPAPPDSLPSGCNGHCCNGMAGMTCCTAVLAADVSTAPVSLSSFAFLFLHAAVLLGLVPEALPKPPKSFG